MPRFKGTPLDALEAPAAARAPMAAPQMSVAQEDAYSDDLAAGAIPLPVDTSRLPIAGEQPPPAPWQPNAADVRADGSRKGTGWLGVLERPGGGVSTEISVGVELDGQETEIPLIVPGLTQGEVNWLLTTEPGSGTPVPDSIMRKAVTHARQRLAQGQSPFAGAGEGGTAAPRAPRFRGTPLGEGMTEAEARLQSKLDAVNSKVDAIGGAKEDEDSQFVKGLKAGVMGQNASMLGGASEAFGILGGSEQATGGDMSGADVLDYVGQALQQWGGEHTPPPRVGSIADVMSYGTPEEKEAAFNGGVNIPEDLAHLNVGQTLKNFGDYVAYSTGSAIGTSAPSLVTGGAAALASSNPVVGALVGAVGPSYLQNTGDVYTSAKRDEDIAKAVKAGKITKSDIARVSAMAGVPMALLDALGVERVLGTVFKEARGNLVKRILKGVATGAVAEGSTEGLQNIVSQWAQTYLGQDKETRERVIELVDNVLGGVFGGGAMGGAGTAVGEAARRARGSQPSAGQPAPEGEATVEDMIGEPVAEGAAPPAAPGALPAPEREPIVVDAEGNAEPAGARAERMQAAENLAQSLERAGRTEEALELRRQMAGYAQESVPQPDPGPRAALPAPGPAEAPPILVDTEGNAESEPARAARLADIEARARAAEAAGRPEDAIALRRDVAGYQQEKSAQGIADESRAARLPPDWTDPRLARDFHRVHLQQMADDLLEGGGVAYVRDENDRITGRTPSLNPDWFKGMNETDETKMTVVATRLAVQKALAGERLGVREARVIGAMLDEITGQRQEQVEYVRRELEKARAIRSGAMDPFEDPDMESAGELFQERDYRPDWDGETRAFYELADQARQVDADAVEAILESQADDATVARRLAEIIHGQQAQPEAQPDAAGRDREAGRGPQDEAAPEAPAAQADAPRARDEALVFEGEYSRGGGNWRKTYRTVTRSDGTIALERVVEDEDGTKVSHLTDDGWVNGEAPTTAVFGVQQIGASVEKFPSTEHAWKAARDDAEGGVEVVLGEAPRARDEAVAPAPAARPELESYEDVRDRAIREIGADPTKENADGEIDLTDEQWAKVDARVHEIRSAQQRAGKEWDTAQASAPAPTPKKAKAGPKGKPLKEPKAATTTATVSPPAAEEPTKPTTESKPSQETQFGTENKVFTADAAERARQRLKSKLGRLNAGIDPEMMQDGITLAGYYIEGGARAFADYSAKMVGDLGEGIRPYLRAFYEAVRNWPGFDTEGMTSAADIERGEAQGGDEKAIEAFAERLRGEGFGSITDARKLYAEVTGQKAEGATQKRLEELLEAAVVRVARDIAASAAPDQAFDELVALYGRQPNLNTRTSTSIENQAYSTPAPLAFLASRLAGAVYGERVLEPTAGNGMLLLEVDPARAVVNELNPDRAAALRAQGFTVTERNAATEDLVDGKVDVVIQNPPFGILKDESGDSIQYQTPFSGYKTTEIDHAIVLRTLADMKDDGSAVLIVGGLNKQLRTEDARSDGYNASAKRRFYYHLYQHYNVVDHFTVAGELYSRQGAAWPVDVIVIRGRGKSARELPAVAVPSVYTDWESLKPLLGNRYESNRLGTNDDGERAAADRGDGGERAGTGPGPVPEPAGGPDTVSGGRVAKQAGRGDGTAERAVRGGAVPGSRDDTRGRGGEPAGVEQPGRAGTAGERGRPAAEATTAEGSERSENGAQDGAERPPVGAGRVGGSRNEAAVTDSSQVQYQPASKSNAIGTLVPTNMQTAVQDALAALSARAGSPDAFVERELGYKAGTIGDYLSAEQVDALALALDQMKAGKGFIIGDQTGIGKGRVVAGVIRWAMQNGKTPIFVTEKPNLYGDMYRDLTDIGVSDVRPVMTNAGEKIPLDESGNAVLQAPPSNRHNADLARMTAEANLGDYNMIFTTYSQMQTLKGARTERMNFLEAFAQGGVVIFDESHNAGGNDAGRKSRGQKEKDGTTKEGRAAFARQLAAVASGVFYSSATYAKRPSVMDLYFKTDMAIAVESDVGKLPGAIQAGGVPLQQAVAAMLAQAGQYIRRERSFKGVEYDTVVAPVDRRSAEAISGVMRAVQGFDSVKKAAIEVLKKQAKKEAALVSVDGATGGAGAESTNFTAIMHNLIDQMLLALKADQAADMAIEALKRGEKPVITVANTMGSFIESYASGAGLVSGDRLGLTFKDLMARYLERSRDVTIKDAQGRSLRRPLTDEELGTHGVRYFKVVKKEIANSPIADNVPISPIDWLHFRLREAGYSSSEITGRTNTVEYRKDGEAVYRTRSSRETSIAGRRKAVSDFNSGKLDAIILNQAGSTGLSLHASEKFKDQRRRTMIIAQPEKNIDTHMQMLGRVHRTGQVVAPRYQQMVADIPAEKRPAAVLAKKMASLNANTTASRSSQFTSKDTVDFLNDYGDEVVAQLMADMREVHIKLGSPLNTDEDGFEKEDAARKVTGRIPLLPVKEQEELYDIIEQSYRELVAQKEALGENMLEAKTLELDAKKVGSVALFEGDEGGSPFAQGAQAEIVDVKRLGKPYTVQQVVELVQKALDKPNDSDINSLANYGREHTEKLISETLTEAAAYRLAQLEQMEQDGNKDEAIQGRMTALDGMRDKWTRIMQRLMIGEQYAITLDEETTLYGVITNIQRKKGIKNPTAPGGWSVQFALADGARSITFPMSKLDFEGSPAALLRRTNRDTSGKELMLLFEEGQTTSREKRIIVTGNLLAGFSKVGRGMITNYTTADGRVQQGILMPRSFDMESFASEQPVELDPENVARFLNAAPRGIVKTADGILHARNRNGFQLATPRSKSEGGRYYLDPDIRAIVGDFTSSGQVMTVDVSRQQLQDVLDLVRRKFGQRLLVDAFKKEAEDAGGRAFGKGEKPGKFARMVEDDAAGVTDSPEFRRWFGDSKVVDADGKPLVVYHGTDADFYIFDLDKAKRGRWGKRFYFAETPERARAYGKNVVPVYLRIEKPSVRSGAVDRSDGLIIGSTPGDRIFAVDLPEQVKSATGNQGTFDPSNPDIRFARMRAEDTTLGPAFDGPEIALFPTGHEKGTDKHTYTIVDTAGDGSGVGELVLGIADGKITRAYAIFLDEDLEPSRAGRIARRVLNGLRDTIDAPIEVRDIVNPDLLRALRRAGLYGETDGESTGSRNGFLDPRGKRGSEGRYGAQPRARGEAGEGRADTGAGAARTRGSTPQAVREYLERKLGRKAVAKLIDSGLLAFADSTSPQAPADVRRAARAGQRVFGYFDGRTSWLFTDNLSIDGQAAPGTRDAYGILMHELGVHFGMRQMLGERLFKEVIEAAQNATGELGEAMARVRRSFARTAAQMHAEGYIAGRPQEDTEAEIREEHVAWLVTDAAARETSLGRRIIAKLRAFVVKLGFVRFVSTDTLVELARGAAMKAAGQRLNAGQGFARGAATDTPAFKRWFGDSKVVDADGKPLVVYHGTRDDFSVFEDQPYTQKHDSSGLGFFFTGNARTGTAYAYGVGAGRVMPVYLSLKNPLKTNSWDVFKVSSFQAAREKRKALEQEGYDGIMFIPSDDPAGIRAGDTEFVAFRPEQIKSATGNRGTFDPSNPDIRFAREVESDVEEAIRPAAAAGRRTYKQRARAVIAAIDAKVSPLATLADRADYLKSRYLTLGRIAQSQQVARRIYDTFRGLSEADGQAVYAYLTDTEGTLDAVPPAMRENARRVKAMIEQVGQALVARGVIPPESFEKYQGRYLPRIYLAYLLGDRAVAAVGAGKTLSSMGYAKRRNEDLPQEYRDVVLGEIKDPAFLASKALGVPLRDMAIMTWLAQIAENPAWALPKQVVEWTMPGFDRPRKVTPYWLKSEATRLRERAEFYKGQNRTDALALAAQMDEAADAALREAGVSGADMPEGYKQIPNSGRYGALRGLVVKAEIFDDLVGLGRVMSADASLAERILGYGGIGSKITGLWKWSKVAANPPAQIRNVVSNMVLLNLSGVAMHRLPGLLARAAKEVRTKGRYWQIGQRYGITESTFAAQEMQRIERETLDYLARQKGRFSLLQLRDYFERFRDWTGDVYQASEMLGKLVKIIDAMEREGMGEADAALAAQEWLFDYSLVGQNTRYLRNAPIGAPFLTFAIKVLPRLLEVAITAPWRFLPYVGLYAGASILAQTLTGADDDDLDRLQKSLPDWLQERGHAMLIPVKDEHGRWQYVDLGYFFPWTYWTELVVGTGRAVKDLFEKGETKGFGEALMGSGLLGGPIPDLMAAAKTGVDPFTGKEIADDRALGREKFAAWMTYLWNMAMPSWLAGIPPFHDHATYKGAAGHLYEALTGATDKRGEPRATVGQALLRFGGVNVYPVEPEKSRRMALVHRRYEIRKTMELMRAVARDRSLDKDDRDELVKDYRAQLRRMQADMVKFQKESVVAPELR